MKTITPTPPAHCTFDPEDWLRLARCWHPVARACDIDGAPVKATLLDEQLVIYRIKGQVVVARIDDEVTVKRLKKQGSTVELLPENSEFSPIVVDLRQQSFSIEGLAVGVIRNGDWQ